MATRATRRVRNRSPKCRNLFSIHCCFQRLGAASSSVKTGCSERLIAATANNIEERADPDDKNGDYCAFYSNQLLPHSLITAFDDVTIAPQHFPGSPESLNIHWRTSHVTSADLKV